MIDTDERPHRTTSNNSSSSSTTSELFICFTSRLSSSSSMKISSKSIHSPGRTRETSRISLSSSLSRRLRSNGSMKGGQASPAMFPTNSNNKKRGCGFENPEPSSPKVTCIGQVRVKTKKQGKKIRARSKRRSGEGEVSFRKVDQNNTQNNNVETNLNQDFNLGHLGTNQFLHQHHQQQQECLPQRNQRWVHLPITICEALRAFGAEFNCFVPCRSSCMANNQRDNNSNKEEKTSGSNGGNGNGNGSTCGAVFARWLVAVQEGEGEGEGKEIELVVGEDEEEEEDQQRRRSQRRHIFDDIEIDGIEIKNNSYNTKCEDNKAEEEARVSVCIPPKNALLLMHCRSDPAKMAALANRFWESPVPQDEVEEEEEKDEVEEEEEKKEQEQRDTEEIEDGQRGFEHEMEYKENVEVWEKWVSSESIVEQEISIPEAETSIDLQRGEGEEEEEGKQETSPDISEAQESTHESNQEDGGIEYEVEAEVKHTESVEEETMPSFEDPANGEIVAKFIGESEKELENEVPAAEAGAEQENHIDDENENKIASSKQEPEEDLSELEAEKKGTRGEEGEDTATHERSEPKVPVTLAPDPDTGSKERGSQQELARETNQNPVLPDCLLLMMSEPKLSMEVSKETWVCSTDFIRCLPEKAPVNKTDGGDDPKKRISTESNKPAQHSTATQPAVNQVLRQPPRSSCSYPAAPPFVVASHGDSSIATVIEQKLIGAKAYEPFVLTRCKSEPMRSAAKLAPDACFWKNRKLEPYRPGTLGVGAAGVGF